MIENIIIGIFAIYMIGILNSVCNEIKAIKKCLSKIEKGKNARELESRIES